MRLIITEKPSVAQNVAAVLPGPTSKGNGFISCEGGKTLVSWCFGHILETKEPDEIDPTMKSWKMESLPFTPWPMPLKAVPKARAQLGVLKDLCGKATEIVIAGDADREGELLVREVLEYARTRKPMKRLWAHDQTPDGLRKTLADLRPSTEFDGLYHAGLGRQAADYWVGMSLTRAWTLSAEGTTAGGGVVSVGRVQTPTMALVVKRDLEIENFKPRDYFTVEATFQLKQGFFKGRWEPDDNLPVDEAGRTIDRSLAEKAAKKCSGRPAVVSKYEDTAKKELAPLPLSLPMLQAACNTQFGFSAQKALDLAQALYERHKVLSYPRSECRHLPKSIKDSAGATLRTLAATVPSMAALVPKTNPSAAHPAFDDSKVEAHYGIVPTGMAVPLSSLSPDEQKVYELVCRTFVALFLPAFQYRSVKVEVTCENELFKATGKIATAAGWKEAYGTTVDDDEDEGSQKLPVMKQGEPCLCKDALVQAKQTKPPSPFTEATLLEAMTSIHRFVTDEKIRAVLKENSGIGTSATRASIIERLLSVGYIRRKGRKLESTDKARAVYKMLPEQLREPGVTAWFEQKLGEIAEGKGDLAKFLETVKQFLAKQVDYARNVDRAYVGGHRCPMCKAGWLRRVERKDRSGYFWGCGRWREGCKAGYNDDNGKPDFEGRTKKAAASGGSAPAAGSKPAVKSAAKPAAKRAGTGARK